MSSITIVEGPAGSGKSTYIQRLKKERDDITVVESLFTQFSQGDRFPSTEQAPTLSLISDAAKAIQAWSSHQDVYLDRFCLSQFVYQRLREKRDQEPFDAAAYEKELSHALLLMVDILNHTYDWVYNRLSKVGSFQELNLVLLVPTPDLLIHRRNLTLRKFPYGLRDQVEYQRLAMLLSDPNYAEQFSFSKVEVLKR